MSKRLLETMLDWYQSSAIAEVYRGTVDELRAAHRCYEKNGFEEIAQSELPLSFPVTI